MNYKFYLDHQLRLYGIMTLSCVVAYGIAYYFGFRQQLIVTPSLLSAFVSGSLSFIFISAYIMARQDPFNKG